MILALQQTVMIRVVQEPVTETTAADVLLGAIGLTGVLIVGALLLGALFGAILIGIKKMREKYNLEAVPDSEALRIVQ
jgi:hypothetical protein